MSEPATGDSSVGEQTPGISSTHPLALESIWSNISMHLTTHSSNEWLRVARTCRASRDVQVPQLVLTKDTPVAGVPGRSCGVAVSIKRNAVKHL